MAAVHHYHRKIRVAHHWGYHPRTYYRPRYAYYPRYAFYRPMVPGFLYGLFGW